MDTLGDPFYTVPLAVSAFTTYKLQLQGPMLLYGFAAGMITAVVLYPEEAKRSEFLATVTASAPQLAIGTVLGVVLSNV